MNYTFNTIALLKSFSDTGLVNGDIATVTGYYSLNDGGYAQYFWDNTNTDLEDVLTIKPNTNPLQGRWKRIIENDLINIKSIGCKDYDSDNNYVGNSQKIQELINKNVHVFIPKGKFRLTSTLEIKRNNGEPESIRRGYHIIGSDVSSSFLMLDANVDGIKVFTLECNFKSFSLISMDITNPSPNNSGFIIGNVDTTSNGSYEYGKDNGGYCVIKNVNINGLFNKHLLKYGIVWHHGPYLFLENVKVDYISDVGLYCSAYNIDNNHGVLNLIANSCKKWGLFIERGPQDINGNTIPHWTEVAYPSRHHQFVNLKTFGCGNNFPPDIAGDKNSGGVKIETIDNYGHIFFENTKVPTLNNIDVSNLLFGRYAEANFIICNNFSDFGIRQVDSSNNIVELKDLGDILNTVVGHDSFGKPKFYNLLAQNLRIRNNSSIGYTEISAEGDSNPSNPLNKTVFKVGGISGNPYRINFERGTATSLEVNFDDNINVNKHIHTNSLNIASNAYIKGLDFNISTSIYNIYSVQHEFLNITIPAKGIYDQAIPSSKFNAGSDNDVVFASLVQANNKSILWQSYCMSAGGQVRIKVKNETNSSISFVSLKFNFVIFKTGF